MFDRLTDKINSALKQLSGNSMITEVNVSHTVKEIRKALLEADVHYQITKKITNSIKEKAIGQKVLQSITPGQMMTKIIEEELTHLMGSKSKGLSLSSKPAIIMVVGLQGSGKTTFVAKLANYLKQQENKNPLIIVADVYRPAAIEQLQTLGENVGVSVFAIQDTKEVNSIVEEGIKYAKTNLYDTILIDTAGRQTVDENLMREAKDILDLSQPDEVLFVLDAMIGQDAVNTAQAFHEKLNFTGIAITKMDGDARGGAALSSTYITKVPIKFISDGEKPQDISVFHPDRMAQRILGMGDVTSLVEKAQTQFDEKEAQRLEKKIRKSQFNFNDFKEQLKKIQSMGDMKSLMSMIPGMSQKMKNVQIDENNFVRIEAIINSMTPYERETPDCFKESRKLRIAKGSGRSVTEVNALLKQFNQMQKMMKGVVNGKMPMMP